MSFCSVSRKYILSFQGVDDKKMRKEEQRSVDGDEEYERYCGVFIEVTYGRAH